MIVVSQTFCIARVIGNVGNDKSSQRQYMGADQQSVSSNTWLTGCSFFWQGRVGLQLQKSGVNTLDQP